MSKAVRSRSTKRDRKNPVAMAIVPVAGEDFLVGGLGAGDVETTSCPNYSVWTHNIYFRAASTPTTELICKGARRERESCRRYTQHEQTRALCACTFAPEQNVD